MDGWCCDGGFLFAGRVAQLGFVASIIGEKVTGFGPLKQFGLETGIPLGAASFGLLAFIGFLFVAAVFEVRTVSLTTFTITAWVVARLLLL